MTTEISGTPISCALGGLTPLTRVRALDFPLPYPGWGGGTGWAGGRDTREPRRGTCSLYAAVLGDHTPSSGHSGGCLGAEPWGPPCEWGSGTRNWQMACLEENPPCESLFCSPRTALPSAQKLEPPPDSQSHLAPEDIQVG